MASKQRFTDQAECYPNPKWVRGYCQGRCIINSRSSVLLREPGRPPVLYFPHSEVNTAYLVSRTSSGSAHNDTEASWDLQVGERYIPRAVHAYSDVPASLDGYLCFDWDSMDNWFEEQEEIFVHPRDPRVRIDVLASNRHVEVVVQGKTVASSQQPILLFETGLPVRYYLPKPDVRLDLLKPGKLKTYCPYKGEAHYYTLTLADNKVENIAWYYPYPTLEASKIAAHIAFYPDSVDSLLVDGEKQ